MYCKKCNYMNDDHARFCNNCGAPIETPANNMPPNNNSAGYNGAPGNTGNGQPGFNYGMPYNTPYDRPQGYAPAKVYTNVIPIVSIILSILSMNPIAIILAVIALVKFNEYDKSRFNGIGVIADSAGRMSKGLGIAGIVIASLSILSSIFAVIAGFFGFGLWTELLDEIMDEGNAYYYYSNMAYLSTLF